MTPPPEVGTPLDGPPLRPSFAVRVSREEGRWLCELLAADAEAELPVLERALGDPGVDGRPGPFVLVVDSRLYFVVLRHGPGGTVRALISDATSQEWLLAAEAVERYGITVTGGSTIDDAFDDGGQGTHAATTVRSSSPKPIRSAICSTISSAHRSSAPTSRASRRHPAPRARARARGARRRRQSRAARTASGRRRG